MPLNNLQVFDQWVQGTMVEVDAQFTDAFNAASKNAIVLKAGVNAGDFTDTTFWNDIPNAYRRRDPYGSGTLTPVSLSQGLDTSVKIAGGSFPMVHEPQALTHINKDPKEAGIAFGEIMGKQIMKNKLDTALSALVAGISNAGHTFTAAGNLTRGDMVAGAGVFGDRQSALDVWVTHSKPMTDIYGENAANVQRLFNIDNINVAMDGFGRVIIMTDSDSLVDETTGSFSTLALCQNAAVIEENNDMRIVSDDVLGGENIQVQTQYEHTYNLQLKGYRFDKSVQAPTDADIADGTKWIQNKNSVKDTAGVIVVST